METIDNIRNRFPRVAGLSSFDLLGAFGVAWSASVYYNKPLLQCVGAVAVIGEIAHVAAGVETPITSMIKGRDVHFHDGSHFNTEVLHHGSGTKLATVPEHHVHHASSITDPHPTRPVEQTTPVEPPPQHQNPPPPHVNGGQLAFFCLT